MVGGSSCEALALRAVKIERIWLHDFRNYRSFELALDEGLTVLVGPNGAGKTNVVEAVGLLATLKSFRGAGTEELIRRGAPMAVIRMEGQRQGRPVLIEVSLEPSKIRAQVNRQRLARSRDLLGALRVSIFTPDDLALIKEGPRIRRAFIDDLAVSIDPGFDRILSDYERVVRQRNALLKGGLGPARQAQPGSQGFDDAAASTLDVWDEQLARLGSLVTERRYEILEQLIPLVDERYAKLAATNRRIGARYETSWAASSLADALVAARADDLRRQSSTVGPHRDEISLSIGGFSSRTEASQGEQRTLALALRLGAHQMVTEQIGEPPLLLLDDVLSELDPNRSRALLEELPPGQTLLTSASDVSTVVRADRVLRYHPVDVDGHAVIDVDDPDPVGS